MGREVWRKERGEEELRRVSGGGGGGLELEGLGKRYLQPLSYAVLHIRCLYYFPHADQRLNLVKKSPEEEDSVKGQLICE